MQKEVNSWEGRSQDVYGVNTEQTACVMLIPACIHHGYAVREKKRSHLIFLGCATESLTYMPTGPCGPSEPAFPVKPCKEEKPEHDGSSSSHGKRYNAVMSVNSLSLLELRGLLEVPVSLLDPVRLKDTQTKH